MENKILKEEELVSAIRAQLDESVERLDPKVAGRLHRARMQAVAEATERKGWYGFFPAWLTPARLSLAAVGVVAVSSLFVLSPSRGSHGISPEDLDVITTREDLSMVQDLDFYRWLADNPQLVQHSGKAVK